MQVCLNALERLFMAGVVPIAKAAQANAHRCGPTSTSRPRRLLIVTVTAAARGVADPETVCRLAPARRFSAQAGKNIRRLIVLEGDAGNAITRVLPYRTP
jgi:hypothetical protein